MNILYNGSAIVDGMLTFTEVPNILSIEDSIDGNKAEITFTFNGNLKATVSADSQYYVTLLGETVSNVMSPSDAKNKRFYCAQFAEGTAMSFARALRCCGGIAADFNIIHSDNQVRLIAKTIGEKFNVTNYLTRNIPNELLSIDSQDGSSYSALYNSKIDIDVYASDYKDQSAYITTVEKNFYGNACSFDMSPIITTFSEYGKTKPYLMDIRMIREDGEFDEITEVTASTAIGYHANQSDDFFIMDNMAMVLMNTNRGTNGMKLYSYGNDVPYTVLVGPNIGGWTTTYTARNSLGESIWEYTSQDRLPYGSNRMLEYHCEVPIGVWHSTTYLDIQVGSNSMVRFDVIKPLNAAEGYQRVLWRNEYGGISFFDFSGQRSETDSVDIDTYEKNVFDYYTSPMYERTKVYSNDYKKTVRLTSHIMEEDGKWIFNSLMRSKKVWTEVNGKEYAIIPKTIEVAEDATYNGTYTATMTYEYSFI